MTRRIVALAVCAALIISLAGCGDKDKKKDNSNITAESSSIADNSSLHDSSSSDSSVTDKPAETSKAEVAQTTTTSSQTKKPVTTITTPTIAAGCYQEELKSIKGWDNKYRPSGKYANIKYGTKNAQEYYEVVKAAYDIANNATAMKEYEEETIDLINSNGVSGSLFNREDKLVPKNDINIIRFTVCTFYIGDNYEYEESQFSSLFDLGNAYSALKNKTSSTGDVIQLILAVSNQRKAQVIFSKVRRKDNKEGYCIKITDSNGQNWYMFNEYTYTEKEILNSDYKIIQSDCFN